MQTTDQDMAAVTARYDREAGYLVLKLRDGTQIGILVNILEELQGADADALAEVEITREGLSLHWPKLDVELNISELLARVLGSQSWTDCVDNLKAGEEAAKTVKQVIKDKKKFQKCLGVRTTTDVFPENIADKWKNNKVIKGFKARVIDAILERLGLISREEKKSSEFNKKLAIASQLGLQLVIKQKKFVILALIIYAVGRVFFNSLNASKLNLIGVKLFFMITPLSLKIAAIDGNIIDEERETLKNYFVGNCGYNPVYIDQYMETLEQRPNECSVEELTKDLCNYIKDNEGINREIIRKSIIGILDNVALVIQHKKDEKKQQISFIDKMLTEKLGSDSNT